MAEQLIDTTDIAVWCGLDVGKEEHHACALDHAGDRLYDKPLPQDEAKLREIFAQLLPGDAKTDARDAFVVATTALKMPDTLRVVDRGSEVLAALKVFAGYDDDFAREATRSVNRLRSLPLQIYSVLERVFAGTRLTNKLSLDLLARYGGSTGFAKTGSEKAKAWARKTKHRGVDTFVDDMFAALGQQAVMVVGTAAIKTVIPRVATQIAALKTQRAESAAAATSSTPCYEPAPSTSPAITRSCKTIGKPRGGALVWDQAILYAYA